MKSVNVNLDVYNYKEIFIIVIYVIFLLILSLWVKDIFRVSWKVGFLRSIVDSTTILPLIAIIAGLYLGLSIAVIIRDDFKRVQGAIILFFSFIIILNFVATISQNLVLFLIALVGSSYLALQHLKKPSCGYRPDNKILKLLTYITLAYIVVSLINFYIGWLDKFSELPVGYQYDLIYTVLLGSVFYKFMNYEVESASIFVLGPPRVGKTVFLATLCDTIEGEPGAILSKIINDLKEVAKKEGYLGAWIEPTRVLAELYFIFGKGILFRKCIKISTLDYPGRYLIDELRELFLWLKEKKIRLNAKSFEDLVSQIDFSKEWPKQVVHKDDMIKILRKISESSKLIFLVSAVSIKRQDPDMMIKLDDYISVYKLIVEVSEKPFVLVVNKVDKEYNNVISSVNNIDELAQIIAKDLVSAGATRLIDDKRIIGRKLFTNNVGSKIFVCWVKEKDSKPVVINDKIVGVGYRVIANVL